MPAGLEFICENKNCTEYKKGLVILGTWALGDIDMVIKSKNVEKIEGFKKGLETLKESGRKYACINYPNINNILINGFRVQKWCQDCICIWSWDIMLDKEVKTPEEAHKQLEDKMKIANVPNKCQRCGKDLKTFEQLIEEGINCPHCKEVMHKSSWFSNEVNKEEK